MTPGPADKKHGRRLCGAVPVVCLAATLVFAALHIALIGSAVHGDGLGYFAPLRSVLFDGDLRIDDESEHYRGLTSRHSGRPRFSGPALAYSKYPPGMALACAPGFVLADGILRMGHRAGVWRSVPANGLSLPYEVGFCAASVGWGLLGLGWSYRLARRFFDRAACRIALVGVWLASPLWYYLAFENSMSHAVSAGTVAGFVYHTCRGRWRSRAGQAALVGGLLGLATLVRPQNLAWGLLIPAARWVLPTPDGVGLRPRPALTGGLSFLALAGVGVATTLMAWGAGEEARPPTAIGGTYLAEALSQTPEGGLRPLHPYLGRVLFWGVRPLFVWHPLTAVAVMGLGVAAVRGGPRGRLAAALGIGFLVQMYAIGAWFAGYQGATVGLRMACGCTAAFVFGLSFAAHAACRRMPRVGGAVCGLVVAAAAGLNASLIVAYVQDDFDGDRWYGPREVLSTPLRQLDRWWGG